MNKDEIENLFDDEELEDKNNKEIENDITNKLDDKNTDESEKKDIYGLENKEEYIKDPSLDDVFPDKNDVDIDRLLDKFEEETKEYDDSKDDLEVKSDEGEIKENNNISKKETKDKKKMKLWQKIVVVLICLGLIFGSGLAFLLYGPYPVFRNWLITTAMTTMSHKYLATWFYDDETINKVMQDNYVRESDEETDLDAISFVDYSNSKVMYKNKYEKEILTHEEGATYKLININGDGIRGYLVAIYDPSKVKVATASNMNSNGEMLTTIAEKNNAVVAMNASGFYDPGYMGNGGKPHGAVIKDGKLISNLPRSGVGGGIMGFTQDNKFIMGKMSAEEALNKGVRDAVEFGPFLIVNGEPSFIKGNGGWGTAPRSAIGQRKDGIVLFLVMDGRDYLNGIDGVGMVELTEIMVRYGAYNAANLDGGTSCGLVINGELTNQPVNGSGKKTTRAIPNAWIVTE